MDDLNIDCWEKGSPGTTWTRYRNARPRVLNVPSISTKERQVMGPQGLEFSLQLYYCRFTQYQRTFPPKWTGISDCFTPDPPDSRFCTAEFVRERSEVLVEWTQSFGLGKTKSAEATLRDDYFILCSGRWWWRASGKIDDDSGSEWLIPRGSSLFHPQTQFSFVFITGKKVLLY